MLVRIYKSNRPIIIVLIIITAVLLWLKTFSTKAFADFPFDDNLMPLYLLITYVFSPESTISYYLAFVLIMVSAFFLVQINTRFLLINARTYLPALMFIILSSVYLPLQRLQPLHFCGILLLFVIGRIFSTYRQQGLSFRYFDASLLIAIGSLVYFNFAYYMAAVWAGLIIFRQFNWREWAFTFIGFALPYVFLLSYHYLINNTIEPLLNVIKYQVVTYNPLPDFSKIYITFYSIIGLIVVLSSFSMLGDISKKKIQARKYFLYLLWFFLITGGIFFASPYASLEILVLNSIPLAYLISHYFLVSKRNYLGDFFLLACFGFIAYLQYSS